MDKLINLLKEIRPDIDFNTEDKLIDRGILDSLDIVTIVADICDAFDVEISPVDIIPANFNSAQAMFDMIERLK